MPEGHVSHRNAIRFTAALAGREILRVDVGARLIAQRVPERITGDRVRVVEAMGKHHLFRFESGRTLYSHLMMSGIWRLLPADRPVRTAGRWLAIITDEWTAVQYNGPVIRVVEPGVPIPEVDRLGPDLLGTATNPAAAMRSALMTEDATRAVGDALMDQRLTSGIGNVYKSETCFLAGIDPWRSVGTLSAEEAESLGEIAARLLADGVHQAGRIQTYRPAGGRPSSKEDKWVYGRRGRPCRRCGTPIRSRGQGDANRTTYWCPGCQT